jgi:Tfp pilus assembly protein PilE
MLKVMKKLQKNQLGFGAIEALLVVVVVGLIGGIGYYTYRQHQKTTNASKDASLQQTSEKTSAKASSPKKSSQQSYLVITEWNVKARPNPDLALSYKISAQYPNRAVFDSAQLVAANATCGNGGGGSIGRLKPNDLVNPPEITSYTAEQFASDPQYEDGRAYIVKVGDYYYHYYPNQGPCADVGDLQKHTQDAVKALLQTLQAY